MCQNVSLCKCVQLCFLGIMFGNILQAVSWWNYNSDFFPLHLAYDYTSGKETSCGHFTSTSLAHLPVFDHNPQLGGDEWSVLPSRFADSQLPFRMLSVRTAVSAWRSFPCDRSGLTAKPLMHYRKSLCSPSRCNVEMTSRRNWIPAFSSHLFE